MRCWNEKTIDWYLRAGMESEYPAKVLAEIMPHLESRHTVLDIGSGPGLYALAVAPVVEEVLAVERDAKVLDTLSAVAWDRGLRNIRCINAAWPGESIEKKVHVIISAFGSGEIMTTAESIAAMLDLNPEAVFLVAPGQYMPPFGAEHGTNTHPDAGDTLRLLEKMGVAYNTKHILLDFGQPVRNMAEATEFLAGFLHISHQEAREHAGKIARPHGDGLYLPNHRNVVLISV